MRLTQKIGLLVLVPLVAMTAFAGLAVAVAVADGQRASRLAELVGLGQRCAELARALQDERVAAVSRLVVPGPPVTERSATHLAAVARTDAAVAALREAWGRRQLPEPAGSRLALLDHQLGLLTALRDQTAAGSLAVSAVAFRYRILIASTLDFREVVGQAGQAPAGVADAVRAAVELSRAGEALGLQQVTVLRSVESGPLSRATAAELAASRAAFSDAVGSFTTFAPQPWRAWWRIAATGPDVLAAQALQDTVGRVAPGEVISLDATAWVEALRTRISLVHEVETQVDAALLDWVGRLRSDALRRAGMVAAGVLAATLLAIGLAVRLGRPLLRDLRRLRDGALAVAYERLPQLVARLNQPRGWHDVNPEEAAASVPSTGVAGRHEVGEVAAAFDEVYRAAVKSAADLARSRLGVAQMHISLARRLQRRTSQLTRRLDAAERDEQDQDRLSWLFGLDHLVTLMRRTTDSLLVLGGHGPGSARGEEVLLYDLLRAASAKIEEYARIEITVVDRDVAIVGHAVDELSLLLAELMDNAVVHSQGQVIVHGRRLADRVVVQIIDDGIGMDERRRRLLNERLSAPVVDVAAVSRMGLTVVGLLAAHHGLHVELRANLPRGTIAELVLPAALLRVIVPDGAPRGPVPLDGRHRARPQVTAGVPRPRPPMGQPADATAELPVYGSRTANGLPVRQPQQFPEQGVQDRAWRTQRDPHRVAAGISAYARGVNRARSRGGRSDPWGVAQHRPRWTDDQGA